MIKSEYFEIPEIESNYVEKDVLILAMNINLNLIKPGTLMKIDCEEGVVYTGQVFSATPNSISLFYIESDGEPNLKEFHIDSFTSGSCVPYVLTA